MLKLITCKDENWGDKVGPVIANLISGQNVIEVGRRYKPKAGETPYVTVGSILSWANSRTVVWGAGFSAKSRMVASPPQKICAVRGPMTRKILLNNDIKCPEVYGDPALLYKNYYNPKIDVQYDIGIIPHYIDKNSKWVAGNSSKNINIINIRSGINNVVNEVKKCNVILSSSLHGLIVADTYGVKSIWIKLSDKVIGNGFKFVDYFKSVKRPTEEPFVIHNDSKVDDIIKSCGDYKIDINLERLMSVCPFQQ
jgi:pyruvyltransferase